jgi:hypothetical protein
MTNELTNVYIVRKEDNLIIRAMHDLSERKASRVAYGANINLNREDYRVMIDERNLNEGEQIIALY